MKLYRAKIPVIAKECIDRLARDGDIEIDPDRKADAEADLVAIMEDYLRRDNQLRESIRDHMADQGISYDQYGRTRAKMAGRMDHPTGDDVERFLVRQFIEMLLNSPNVEEVWAEDAAMYRKLMEVIRAHDVDEEAIRQAAREKLKNLQEGTMEFEIAMRDAVREVKKRMGLILDRRNKARQTDD